MLGRLNLVLVRGQVGLFVLERKCKSPLVATSPSSMATYHRCITTASFTSTCVRMSANGRQEVQFNHRLQRNSTTDVTTLQHDTHFKLRCVSKARPEWRALHFPISLYFLDQPNTTSSTNYRFQVVSPNTFWHPTMYFNFDGRTASHMRFMEIAQ